MFLKGERMDGQLLSETFVELADTMVVGFDVIDFLHLLTDRSAQLLDASAAGLLLADPRGELRVVAASSERARLLELFQIQNDQGPCLDCFRSGQPVAVAELSTAARRWPRFAPAWLSIFVVEASLDWFDRPDPSVNTKTSGCVTSSQP